MKRIAVEENLTTMKEYLSNHGYQVDVLDASKLNQSQNNYSAIIISGTDQNLMGIQNVAQSCPVINANGLTQQEVESRLQQLQ